MPLKPRAFVKVMILVAVTIVVGYAVHQSFDSESLTSSSRDSILLPKPEPLTELYFTDPLNLPEDLCPDQTVRLSFTIHNLEFKDMAYTYEVSLVSDSDRTILSRDNIRIAHDQTETVVVEFDWTAHVSRAKVVVDLVGEDEAIHFWVEGCS